MDNSHHYHILGLQPNASEQDVRRAFKRLALKYHPDLCREPGAAQHFKAINRAHQVLKSQVPQGRFGQFDQPDNSSSHLSPLAGKIRQATLPISLEEVHRGVDRLVTIKLAKTQHQPAEIRQLKITLPEGLREGQLIHVNHHQQPLQLKIVYQSHQLFHCDGNHLYIKLPVTAQQAMEGGRHRLPAIEGDIEVEIPPHSRNGDTLKYHHAGLPAGNERGDLHVILYVEARHAKHRSACKLYRQTAGYQATSGQFDSNTKFQA